MLFAGSWLKHPAVYKFKAVGGVMQFDLAIEKTFCFIALLLTVQPNKF